MQITAAVAREIKQPFTVETLELDELRPNEVRVRLVATGICHTDAIVRDGVYPTPLPAVLGHEGAGIVEETGSAVTTVNIGDKVILAAAFCGKCGQCRQGQMVYCENLFAVDFGGRRSDGTTSLSSDGEAISSHFFGQSADSGGHCNSRVSISSIGFLNSSRLRGLSLSSAATQSRSWALWMLKSVPLGKYWRSSPFVFSLMPRCQGECGSQK